MSTTGNVTSDFEFFTRMAEAAFAAQRPDLAGEFARRAVQPSTPNPSTTMEQLHATAIQSLNAGQYREAEAYLIHAIRLQPAYGVLHDHLGVVLANQKRYGEAEATFRLSARLDPTNPSPLRNVIQSCFDQRKYQQAIEAIQAAMKLEPNADELRLQLAVALCELQRLDEAEKLLVSMLESGRVSSHLWNRLGVVRGMAGKPEQAIECFQQETRLDPNSASAYSNLAAALGRLKRWEEAVVAGRESVRLEPRNASGWANLGNAYRDLGRLSEAQHALQQSIQLDPTTHEAFGNMALSLAMQGRIPEALSWYEKAIRIKPDAAEVRFNRAIALLSHGDYANGWVEYEWRWRTEQMKGQLAARRFAAPVWRGESLVGKSILIHTEQGHGDTIQFVKLAAQLGDAGAKVIVVTTPPLVALLQTCRGLAAVLSPLDPVPPHDYHCPLMSLPLLRQLRVDTIPSTSPYLTATPDAIAKWKVRLSAYPGRKVGIAWQGNPQHIGDRWRSVKLSRFAELLTIPNVTVVSLQKGTGVEQLDDPAWSKVPNLGTELGTDFTDTAGLLMNLDLVITIDSALAHLSGALARPVWVALPLNADWRWMHQRTDSPWYPTAKLYRQTTFGDWDPVFRHLATELRSQKT